MRAYYACQQRRAFHAASVFLGRLERSICASIAGFRAGFRGSTFHDSSFFNATQAAGESCETELSVANATRSPGGRVITIFCATLDQA